MDVNAASQLRHLTSLTKLPIRPEAVEASATQLSFSQILTLRQSFEQETQALQYQLGHEQHQTMLVAMYEGTEQLLHKQVPDFAVITMQLTSIKTHLDLILNTEKGEAQCQNGLTNFLIFNGALDILGNVDFKDDGLVLS